MQKARGELKCLTLQKIHTSLRFLRILKISKTGVVLTVIGLMKKIFTITKVVFGKLTAVNAVRNKKTLEKDQERIDLVNGVVA